MKNPKVLRSFACLAALVFVVGCGGDNKEQAKKAGPGEHVHADGTVHQDHGDHGHSHGGQGHSHGEPPHGGTIADWGGGKYHVEFVVNHDKQEATVYILGGDAKSSAAVDAKELTLTIKDPALTVSLNAVPEESDPEGRSSRFVGKHDGLGEVREYEGSITGKVGDTPYSGNFKEKAHQAD
ncbi:MAG: hypothetical protein VX768_12035 [Planctomycetota bacterium]|nr:hypothetical protein [Planctomycetota bacterium]